MAIDRDRFKRNKDGIDDDTWADWLSNLTPSAGVKQEVREQRVKRANTYVPRRQEEVAAPTPTATKQPAKPAAAAVSIQISLPELHRPHLRKHLETVWKAIRPRLTSRRGIIAMSIVGVLLIAWLGLHIQKVHNDRRAAHAAAAVQGPKADVISTKPTFNPVVPSGKQKLATPDGTHSSFDATKGTYTFGDSINSQYFTVSEQQLPPTTSVMGVVSQAAKNVNATTQFKTGWGTAYMSSNQSTQSEYLVFGVGNILVLIQSGQLISTSTWTTYINSLN